MGASCLTLLPMIRIQSDFSISAIFVLNEYCERWVKGMLHPSCLHSTLLIFRATDSFLYRYKVSKSHKSPDKKAISSGLYSIRYLVVSLNAFVQSTTDNLLSFFI